MTLLIQYTIIYAVVLFLVAIGGCYSERSGVMNLGLEGIMVIGALGGALAMKFLSGAAPAVVIFGVIFASALCGILYSLLLAIPAITLGADQTLIGTAINMLATAFATVFVRSLNSGMNGTTEAKITYITEKDPLMFNVFGLQLNAFVIVALVVLFAAVFIMKKTRFGFRLSACGENPHSAASAGINVVKMRYTGVLISGALAGLGGIAYITSSVSEWSFDYGVAGYGFLAMAVMIFGKWKPASIAVGAVVFGFFRALSNIYSGFDWLVKLNIPGAVYNMLPYLISLLILVIASERSHAPKAVGVPYNGNIAS